MDSAPPEQQECPRNSLDADDDDSQSYMDEEAVREVRLHHWLSETALSTRLAQESAPALARADSPLLGFEHFQLSESDKPLPGLPPSVSRLRSSSTVSSTHAAAAAVASVTGAAHRRSRAISQLAFPAHASRPSVTYAELTPTPRSPQHTPGHSSRLNSISSSLSLAAGRNAVYIDSQDIQTRLDELLTAGNPELETDEDDYGDVTEYYATSFDHRDSPLMSYVAPSGLQAVPPNTPMTGYYRTPQASSSQIFLGKSAPALLRKPVDEDNDATTTVTGHEDVRSTPVPHGKPHARDNSQSSISFTSSSSGSPDGSPVFSTPASLTSQTSVSVSHFSAGASRAYIPGTLSPKASFASLSNMKAILSPRPSLASLAVACQNENQTNSPDSGLLSPPEATASRWSLTSSVAGDIEEKKRKEKGSKRKRLVSMISRITGKEAKQTDAPMPSRPTTQLDTATTSIDNNDTEQLPPVPLKSKSKPPSLKLVLSNSSSMTNLRSLTSQASYPSLRTPLSPLNSATPKTNTTPLPTPDLTSPHSATFTNSSGSSPITTPTSASTCMSPSTMTHSRQSFSRNASSATVPTLKSAVSVPSLLPAWEGRPFVKRENSAGWSSLNSNTGSTNKPSTESTPTSPISEGHDDVDGAEYYVRELGLSNAEYGNLQLEDEEVGVVQENGNEEERRKERLSVIVDLLAQQVSQASAAKNLPVQKQTTVEEVSEKPQLGARKLSEDSRRSLGAGGPPSPTTARRSFSGPPPPRPSPSPTATQTPTVTTPTLSGLKIFAARMGISTTPSPPSSSPASSSPEHALAQSFVRKRKSLLLSTSGRSRRKGPKKRLVISGVEDDPSAVAALREWVNNLGEVRSMVKMKSYVSDAVTQLGEEDADADGVESGRNVWLVDFKKDSAADRVCRLQAKVQINGAGSVRLSWETAKPKIHFNLGSLGWIP